MFSSLTTSGSTDCVCFATMGTNDPVTSALHIIIGMYLLSLLFSYSVVQVLRLLKE